MTLPHLQEGITTAISSLRTRLRSGAYGLSCTGLDGSPRFSDNKGHVFVASFIAEAMHGLLDEIDRTIVLMRILSEENEGCWGFSPPGNHHREESRVFHVDSDDTAYVIRTLQRLGVNRSPESLMRFYREPERVFVTFDAPGKVALEKVGSPGNNFGAHAEVNINVFLALHGTHLGDFINYDMLRDTQDEAGFWASYFYPSRFFATVLALELLNGNTAFNDATSRALSFIEASQNADGSWGSGGDPYETALALTALARHDRVAIPVRRGVEYLLNARTKDGAWNSPACIWEFHASAGDVWGAHDVHGAYVTARCTNALRLAEARYV